MQCPIPEHNVMKGGFHFNNCFHFTQCLNKTKCIRGGLLVFQNATVKVNLTILISNAQSNIPDLIGAIIESF